MILIINVRRRRNHSYYIPLIYVFRELQLENLEIIVADISTFEMEGSYDRILSIGMFEVLRQDECVCYNLQL